MPLLTVSMRRSIAILMCVFCGVLDVAIAAQEARVRSEPETPYERFEARRVFRAQGFRAAAELFGEYRIIDPFQGSGGITLATDLDTLAAASDVVVLGRVLSRESRLSADERGIRTLYELEIVDLMRDLGKTRQVHQKIAVHLPGGRIEFPSGAVAEIVTPACKPLVDGRLYMLALQLNEGVESTTAAESFVPAFGSQGIFELPDDGQNVRSNGNDSSLVARGHNGRTVNDFVRRMRDAANRANRAFPNNRGDKAPK